MYPNLEENSRRMEDLLPCLPFNLDRLDGQVGQPPPKIFTNYYYIFFLMIAVIANCN